MTASPLRHGSHLDLDQAVDTRINWEGYTAWEMNDPAAGVGATGRLFSGTTPGPDDCTYGASVELEYQDNRVENWATNPDLAFLETCGAVDGTPFDLFGVGLLGSRITDNVEIYMFLLFPEDFINGYDALPTSNDISPRVSATCEIAVRDPPPPIPMK